jgi:hypothetical protein
MATSSRTKELQGKAWFRFLTVVYICAYLFIGLIALALYYTGNKTYTAVNTQTSYVQCSNGDKYTYAQLGINDVSSYTTPSYSFSGTDENSIDQSCGSASGNSGTYTLSTYKEDPNARMETLIVIGVGFVIIEGAKAALIYVVGGNSSTSTNYKQNESHRKEDDELKPWDNIK